MKIRNIIFCCGLLSLFFSAQAATLEQEAVGPSAENFIQSLRLSAGIHPKKISSHYTYDVDSLYCHSSSDATEDGFPSYDCTINSKSTITDASAKLLYDAMAGLNIWDEPGMSQTRLRVEHVHCLLQFTRKRIIHCWWQDSR